MTTPIKLATMLALCAPLAFGSLARADLTGTYQGKFKCKAVVNDGSKQNLLGSNSTLKIIHDPVDDTIRVDIDETPYCGRVIATKPGKKGVGVFVVVGTTHFPFNYNEIEHITWTLGKKARVKKRGFWVDSEQIGECKGGWSRTSDSLPAGNFASCQQF
jgi:hypothetical protein